MRCARLLCAVALTIGPVLIASGQPVAATALSPALRTHLQGERLGIVTSIRGLPLGVRDALQKLFGSATLDIAEPGSEFQGAGPAVNRQLPTRRLIAAGCSNDFHCLVYYERGGAALTTHVMLFQWTPAATRFEWGGTAPRGLTTIEDVRKAVVSGAVKSHPGPW